MPGILGTVRPSMSIEIGDKLIQNMIQPLRHYPWYQEAKASMPGATLGVVSLGRSPRREMSRCHVSADGRYVLTFDGELYNTAELVKDLKLNNAGAGISDAALALAAILHWGNGAFARFNGLFQVACWDSHKQELILAGDPGGLRPIYLAHKGETLAFAPEVKALLSVPAVSREIDFQGIMSFVQYGFPVGDRTFFRDVKVLPGGAFARFHRGQLQIERYWKMQYQEDAKCEPRGIQEHFLETWQDAIQRQTDHRPDLGSLLSGGMDTRLILAGLVAQEKKVRTFTFGVPDSQEVRLARQVAAASQCVNFFTPVGPSAIANGLERTVYLTDGMYNVFHANVRHLLPSLADSASVVFDGISPLDCYYRRPEVPFKRMLGRTDSGKWLRQAYAGYLIDDVHAVRLGRQTTIDLMNGMDEFPASTRDYFDNFIRVAQSNNLGSLSTMDLFDFEEYLRRFNTFGPYLLRTVVEVRCPFFDKKILELVKQLSPKQRGKDKFLHQFAILKLAPEMADIPVDRTSLPLRAGFVKTYLHLGAKFIRRKSAALLMRQRDIMAKSLNENTMIDYNELIRTAPTLQSLVSAHLALRWEEGSRFFNRRSLQLLLAHHLSRSVNGAELIGRLLTVEMWYRLFIRDVSVRPVSYTAKRELTTMELA